MLEEKKPKCPECGIELEGTPDECAKCGFPLAQYPAFSRLFKRSIKALREEEEEEQRQNPTKKPSVLDSVLGKKKAK